MAKKLRVLVLGAGFGGLELASRLSGEAADRVDVTVINQNDGFVFGFSKLDRLFGRSDTTWRTPYSALALPSVTFHQERILRIDPETKKVETTAGSYDADVIVVALGADLDVSATPGLADGGHEFYSVAGTERAAAAVRDFGRGHAVIAVAGTPYKCPPAPCEAALMLDDYLVERARRSATAITVMTPLPAPVPPSPGTSAAIHDEFAMRGITFRGGTRMTSRACRAGRSLPRRSSWQRTRRSSAGRESRAGSDRPFRSRVGDSSERLDLVIWSVASRRGWLEVTPPPPTVITATGFGAS